MTREENPTAIVTTKQTRTLSDAARSSAKTSPQFDAAFLDHWQSVQRTLTRLVGDAEQAQDLALETFWRLYQHFPSNERAFNIGGWLYRVATNLGLNALRAQKRRERYELETAREESDADDPAQNIVAEEDRARVRTVLGAMDSRQAQLLWLRYDGMSYAELATALDLAPSSVGTLLAR